MPKEQVLVFPTELLFNEMAMFDLGLDFSNSPLITQPKIVDGIFQYLMNSNQLLFMDRDKAEKDAGFKQFVPYLTLIRDKKYFCYKRSKKSNEKRLHDLWSIGIGGHICKEDEVPNQLNNTFYKGLYRELKEETGLTLSENPKPCGVIYDDSNLVGQVHLGFVFKINVDINWIPLQSDKTISQGDFEDLSILLKNKSSFENWSRFILENL